MEVFCLSSHIQDFSLPIISISLKGLGTPVNLRTSFHPQTDGHEKCTVQTLVDMLTACVIDLKGSWYDHIPLIEFA